MLLSLCVYRVARGFTAVCSMLGLLSRGEVKAEVREDEKEAEGEGEDMSGKVSAADGGEDIPIEAVTEPSSEGEIDVQDGTASDISLEDPSSVWKDSGADIFHTPAVTTGQRVAVSQAVLSKCVYWCLIALITAFYTRSTVSTLPLQYWVLRHAARTRR